MNSAINLEQL